MPSRVLETVLTGRNLLSPTLTAAARDVESFDAKVTAATTRTTAAVDAGSKSQVSAADRVIAANTRTATSSEAMSAKIAASQKKAGESARAFADVSESSAARTVASFASIATKGLPLVAGAAAVVFGKMAADYQTLVVKLETTAGESQKNIAMVSQGMLDMAGKVGVSAKELATGMYTVESAGFHGSDALKVLQASAEGARQENADLGKVTDAVSTVLHDYHLKASDAATVTSQLVDAVAHGKTTFDLLTGSLHSITPLASVLNISLADVTGTLAAMTASGESADQATQNMADTLRHLANPTNTMLAELAQLGISASDLSASLSSRGLAGTLQFLEQTIVQHVDPATQKVLLPALNQSKTAAQDLQIMISQMPPSLQAMSKGLLDGSVSIKDYTKGAKDLGGTAGAMATNFLGLYKSSDGFNSVLKAGGPAAQVFEAALAKSVGTSAGLNVLLQTTGENASATSKNIADIGKATQQTDGNIKGWAEVQGTFNQKLHEAVAGAGALAIQLGQHLLPAGTAVFGWIADHGIPDLEHLGSAVGTSVHWFSQLPPPVRDTAAAFAALKLADHIGLWTKLTAIPTQFAAGVKTAASSVGSLSDKITVQQALFAMEQREATAAAVSVERLGQAEKAAATWATSASTAQEASAAADAAASARRVAAIEQLTAKASTAKSTLSGAQQTLAQWDRQLSNEAPAAASLAEGGIGRFRAGLATLASRAIPAVKAAGSSLLNFFGGPWGVGLLAATGGIIALIGLYRSYDEQIKQATQDVQKWNETLAFGTDPAAGPGASAVTAGQHLDDLRQKIAALQKQIDAYNAAAKGGYARGGIGTLVSQQTALKQELANGTTAWKEQLAAMTPVEEAQARYDIALHDLNMLLKQTHPNTQEVTNAEIRLHDAQANLNAETERANDAQKTQIQRLQDQATAALGLLDAQRASQLSQMQLQDAIDQYNSDAKDGQHTTRQLKEEQLGLADSARQTAQQAADAAAAQAKQNGATDTGAASQAAFVKSLQQTAGMLTGDAKQAVLDMITALAGQDAQAVITAGAINNIGVTVLGLPDEHLITIDVPTDAQMQKLHDLGYATVTLPDGKVVVSADTNPAQQEIQDLLNYARAQSIEYRADPGNWKNGSLVDNSVTSGSGRLGTYAAGGYTGPGAKYTPAGLVHAGEFVMPSEAVDRLGVGFLGALAGLPGYAGGGWVNVPPGGAYLGSATIPVSEDVSAAKAAIHETLSAMAAMASPYAGMVLGASSQQAVQIGARMAMAAGWTGVNWNDLFNLWMRESGWNPYAVNPSSGAYGIPQSLGHGHPYNLGDPAAQIAWGLSYIGGRYGTPANAWAHEMQFGWYDQGGPLHPGWTLAYNGTGHTEQVVNTAAPAMPGYGYAASPAATAPTQITFSLQGARISGRLELGTDGFVHLVDARVDDAFGQLADSITNSTGH